MAFAVDIPFLYLLGDAVTPEGVGGDGVEGYARLRGGLRLMAKGSSFLCFGCRC